MSAAASDLQFSGLTKCLIREELLTEESAQTAIEQANKQKISLISNLLNNNHIDSKTIASFLVLLTSCFELLFCKSRMICATTP